MEFLFILYCLAAVLLALFGINCHVLIHLFKRRLVRRKEQDYPLLLRSLRSQLNEEDWPVVTTQIPIYNELNVAERIIDAVAGFDYPAGRQEIQILDDSTDETSAIVAQKVKALKDAGVWVEHIMRCDRKGFKAGALKNGLEKAKGDFIAIFDADFVPPCDFLRKTVPHFLINEDLGLVQGRWGHLNEDENLLTRIQSVGMNGHFIVEQPARNWNGLFMNFNGTAGVFRKGAILEAGNWHEDTLTEDLDLSYRMQLAGWKCRYLIDLVAPAEIPSDIIAFKNQQFRWAKGSIQTARKILPRVWDSDHSFFSKLQSTLHMTHYAVHPLMLFLAIMSTPLLAFRGYHLPLVTSMALSFIILLSTSGPSRLYIVAERYLVGGWTRRLLLLPCMICLGCGLAVNNTRAVFEGLLGKKGEFVRTPKRGLKQKKSYTAAANSTFIVEAALGLWCFYGMFLYLHASHYFIGYFLLMYALGFVSIGTSSFICHVGSLQRLRAQRSGLATRKEVAFHQNPKPDPPGQILTQ